MMAAGAAAVQPEETIRGLDTYTDILKTCAVRRSLGFVAPACSRRTSWAQQNRVEGQFGKADWMNLGQGSTSRKSSTRFLCS